MKYIKSYKIFESLESDYLEIIADLEDMCVDIQDLDVEVEIWSERLKQFYHITTPVPESYNNAVQIIFRDINKSALREIKYFIKRSIEYMEEWEVKYFGSKNFKVYDFDLEELENSDFYDIYIRFYKTENTYHIVSYRSYSWKIIEADFKSKDEAEDWFVKSKYSHYKSTPSDYSNDKFKIISDEEYWEALGDPNYFS